MRRAVLCTLLITACGPSEQPVGPPDAAARPVDAARAVRLDAARVDYLARARRLAKAEQWMDAAMAVSEYLDRTPEPVAAAHRLATDPLLKTVARKNTILRNRMTGMGVHIKAPTPQLGLKPRFELPPPREGPRHDPLQPPREPLPIPDEPEAAPR
jgi:hypothetical protein